MDNGRDNSQVWSESKEIVTDAGLGGTAKTVRVHFKVPTARAMPSLIFHFKPDTEQVPASYAGCTFTITSCALDPQTGISPMRVINNAGLGNQQAPDGWEGEAGVREYWADFTATPISVAGHWRVIGQAEPAPGGPMTEREWEHHRSGLQVWVEKKATVGTTSFHSD